MTTIHEPISPEMKARAVELYREGAKTAEIFEQTGVSRPALYMLLRQRNETPNRLDRNSRRFTPGLDAAAIQHQLRDALVQLGQAQAENEILKQRISVLEGELERLAS